MANRNPNTVEVSLGTKEFTFHDGDVLSGRTPKGKNTLRVRINGAWQYLNGKDTGKSDQGYATGLVRGAYSKVFSAV